jgi:signal transduction histidine kinase
MCVLIQDRNGWTVYWFDMLGGNCLIHTGNSADLYRYRQAAAASPGGKYYAEVHNPRFNTNTLLFVLAMGEPENPTGYIYLNTSLEPLDSTVGIIKTQIFWVSAALLATGFGISFFLAKLIEAPIKRITRSAKRLGQGEFDEDFDGRGYFETELLAEALNYAASEMSNVSRLRREIIANVSHDLRTPLTMVKAYAEMVRDISGDNPEKRNEHIGVIIDESDRLASLVKDILDLSVLESGAAELNITEFDITGKISGIMGRYKVFSERQGYEFILAADKPFAVKADVAKIEQVLYNLINNAVNYTGDSKTVYIVQRNFEDRTLVEITDTGAGIDDELLPLIFDRYYRAEKSKRDVFGTGLGLSIVKQILKQHDCKFGVRSLKGTGSTFWFEIKGKPIDGI